MENITNMKSNYTVDYTTFQLSLPLNLEVLIEPDDKVFSFLRALKGVDLNKYLKRTECRGRKGYDNVRLLMTILFARMEGYHDLRSLEELCRSNIKYMFLMQEERPSFMALECLMTDYLIEDIDQIFFDITRNIERLMGVNTSIQYIDGTKIEANANRYTFVYRTRIINARWKLYTRITESIVSMNSERGFSFPYHHQYCAQEIGYIVQYLMECMVSEGIEPVYGKGKKKHPIQRWYDIFMSYYTKLGEYEYWLDVIGDRNSCSKTDHDATMCATKMDYYCRTGLSRPCYNAQIAVSDGIIVNADLFQRPGDTKTFIPFMERYHMYNGEYPIHPMADAGYGSYDNYMYCASHGMELCMKYSMYARKNEPKFRKRKFNPLNWEKDDKGYRTCPNGHAFDLIASERYDDSGENLRIIQMMGSEESCEGCPFMSECCRKGHQRRILSRDIVLEQFYGEVDANLSSEFGKELKKQRSIQVEGAFGVIKQDMKFTRFTRKGLENAKMEFLIVCLGYNLIKYHRYRLNQDKENGKKALLN